MFVSKLFRSASFWTLCQSITASGFGVVIVLLQAKQLSPDQIGAWQFFSSLNALIGMIGSGSFTPSVQRFASYFKAGASNICAIGLPASQVSRPNWFGMKSLMSAMSNLYLFIAVIAAIIAAVFLLGFVHVKIVDEMLKHECFINIPLFLLALVGTLYNSQQAAILQGFGAILATSRIAFCCTFLSVLITIWALYSGLGIISMGLAISAQAVLQVALCGYYLRRYRKISMLFLKRNEGAEVPSRQILACMWPTTWRFSSVMLGSWAIHASGTMILAMFSTLELAGMYGLTLQVLNIITNISSTWIRTYTPLICQAQVQKNSRAAKEMFVKSCVLGVSFFIILLFGFFVVAPWLFDFFGLRFPFLGMEQILLLSLVVFLEFHHGNLCATYLMTENQVPFVKSAFVSGALIIAFSCVLVIVFEWNVWGIICARGLVQAAYNNWWWPYVVYKKLFYYG